MITEIIAPESSDQRSFRHHNFPRIVHQLLYSALSTGVRRRFRGTSAGTAANLPEEHKGRWGDGLTADDMKKCVWVRPELVAQIEFLEWTDSDHLRHSKFVGLREDKDARIVTKEV